MSRIFTAALAVLLVATGSASGQDWARKMFKTTEHNFGTVARGSKIEYRFRFQNIYKEDVHITGVRSSCGCTQPSVSKDLLHTRESADIIAVFNTFEFSGDRHATLTVTIDQPFSAEVQLQITGYIRTDVVLRPGAVEFGSVDHGTPVERVVSIDYAGRSDWKITGVKTSNNFLKADVLETGRTDGQVKYDLKVTLKDDAPVGYLKEELTLLTNDRRATQCPVDVEGRIVPEISISPASLMLGIVKPGQKVTKQLVVKGKKPFKIVAVHCDDPSFQITVDDASKALHLLPITFEAGEQAGKLTQKIRIETDLGEGATAEISAHAQVIADDTADAADADEKAPKKGASAKAKSDDDEPRTVNRQSAEPKDTDDSDSRS